MIFYKQRFLKSEISSLEKRGLISPAQKDEIFAHYGFSHQKSSSSLLFILAFVLFSLSIITLIGYNWEQIPAFIRTTLLLITLLCAQIALYLSQGKRRIYSESIAVLANSVLLGNIALLSQIYHLGDNSAMALLSVAFVSLFMAFAIRSGIVFWQAYILSMLAFYINITNGIFTHSFGVFIALGFILQAINGSKFLAFFNFFALLLHIYYAPFGLTWFSGDIRNIIEFSVVAFYLSLLFLALNAKSYKIYALFICALVLLLRTSSLYYDLYFDSLMEVLIYNFSLHFSFPHFLWWLVFLVPVLLAFIFKRYFWASFGVLFWCEQFGVFNYLFSLAHFSEMYWLFIAVFYSVMALVFGAYLIKVGHKILGILVLIALIAVRYFDLIGDYIGASIVFAIFGLVLLFMARKRLKGGVE